MKKFLLSFGVLFIISCGPSVGSIIFINRSQEPLALVSIRATSLSEEKVLEVEDVKLDVVVEKSDLRLQSYFLEIHFLDTSFIKKEVLLTKSQNLFEFQINKDRDLITIDGKTVVSYSSVKQLSAIEKKIDTLMGKSKEITEEAIEDYASLLVSFLDKGLTISLDSTLLANDAEVRNNIERISEFEINYPSVAIQNEIEEQFFNKLYVDYLKKLPDIPKRILPKLDFEGIIEDDDYIYNGDCAIHKLNYHLIDEIKLLCGITSDPSQSRGFKLALTPLWSKGKIRYAFHKDKGGSRAFKERMKANMDKWSGCFPDSDALTFEDVSDNKHLYRLWHIGMAYITMISVEPLNDNYSGLAGFPGQVPWQFLKIDDNYTSNDHTMLHELGHNLGLMHEHQRLDRDAHLISADSGPQWLTFGGHDDWYDINSIMHYGGCSDYFGNVASNSGYLSELDKMYITKLYDKDNSYQSSVPIVDRITFLDNTLNSIPVYEKFNSEDMSFSDFDLASYSPFASNRNEYIPFGVLDLPGFGDDNGSCKSFRISFNKSGFTHMGAYSEKNYYIDYRDVEDKSSIILSIKKFLWQTLVLDQDIKMNGTTIVAGESINYDIVSQKISLTEVVNKIKVTSTSATGNNIVYNFFIVRQDNNLREIIAKNGEQEVFRKNSFDSSSEYCINYFHNSDELELTFNGKKGQTIKIGTNTFTFDNNLSYCQTINVPSGTPKTIEFEVYSTDIQLSKHYKLNLESFSKEIVPESLFITTDQGGSEKFLDLKKSEDFVGALQDKKIVVKIYSEKVDSVIKMTTGLKSGQKLFLSRDNANWDEITNLSDYSILSNFEYAGIVFLKVVSRIGSEEATFLFDLHFYRSIKMDCKIQMERYGGSIKIDGRDCNSLIKQPSTEVLSLRTHYAYDVEIRSNQGFKTDKSLTGMSASSSNSFSFTPQYTHPNLSISVDFPPEHPGSYSDGFLKSYSSEVVRCGLSLENLSGCEDISVSGSNIYLRRPISSYQVSISKTETPEGYIHYSKLWDSNQNCLLETKTNYFSNDKILSKTLSGQQTLIHRLYAQKAGTSSWNVQSVNLIYREY